MSEEQAKYHASKCRHLLLGGNGEFCTLSGMPIKTQCSDSEDNCHAYDTTAADVQREERRWIPCSERMPSPNHHVLFYNVKYGILIGFISSFADQGVWYPAQGCGIYTLESVTHWMPLPDAPEG